MAEESSFVYRAKELPAAGAVKHSGNPIARRAVKAVLPNGGEESMIGGKGGIPVRNLTIKREKSFVGSLVKLKVYIEDPASGELSINGTPCRKLGELKNGEEQSFPIGGQAARVYVIADQLSKEFCNDYYQLPEGEADVAISGKNKYNPASGNAFRFEGSQNDAVAANRKRGSRKGLIILILALIAGAVFGRLVGAGLLSAKAAQPKEFTAAGMTVTLTREFKQMDVENFTAAFDSRHAALLVLQERFDAVPGAEALSVEEYIDLVIDANGIEGVEKKTLGGLPAFSYGFNNPDNGKDYRYVSFAYKTGDAFWLLQFATLEKDAEAYEPKIAEWAQSVKFA